MRLDMARPCSDCPFLKVGGIRVRRERMEEITFAIVRRGATFACHNTTIEEWDEEEETDVTTDGPDSQQCAGAMILAEKLGERNQLCQVSERLGFWDPARLDMTAPVFDSLADLLAAQEDW